jgi:hypothetical protein
MPTQYLWCLYLMPLYLQTKERKSLHSLLTEKVLVLFPSNKVMGSFSAYPPIAQFQDTFDQPQLELYTRVIADHQSG